MTQKILWVFGSLGTVLVIAAVLVRLAIPEQLTLWWWLAASGLALLVIYVLLQWRAVVAIFHRRQARYGTLATASLLLGLMIVVSVNYVLARQNKRWDLTAAKQHSLSPQTIRVLESLDSPIKVIVFAQEFDFERYRNRLGEYEYASSQVSLDYVDVDKNPALARAYEVQSYGTVVFEYNDRIERVVSDQEQDLTNALIKAVEGEELKVYFLQGHGERSPENTERDGYMRLAEALRLDNLAVERLPLSQTGSVPPDADVIVIAGPSTDLLPGEIDLLRTYLEEGGKALFLIDPPVGPDNTEPDLLISLIAEWGIEIGQDVVVDVSGVGQLLGTDATVPVATTYPPHEITDQFELLTAFPLARSVRPIESGDDQVAQTVVETSQASWSETNLAALDSGEVSLNEAEGDLTGPISIAAAIAIPIETEMPATNSDSDQNESDEANEDASNQETRIAVFGDSDFAANSTIGIQGNQDLALNAINWLAQQENLISIRPREPEDRRITLTADEQFRIQLLVLLIIPALILGTGVYTRWRSQ
jgi:ABC-type uncharacterized transport system involved in gliding motility auxiliary subunit